jgi:hypothetical protein
MKSLQPSVIVMEPRPRWTPELQRQFLGESVRVRQCATFTDLWKLAEECSVVVLDLDAAPAGVLQFLGRCASRRHSICTITLGSPQTAELEWMLRDLGTLEFAVNIPTGKRLAHLCRRQWTVDGR